MLHVILLILKIIGIVFAALLGIIVLLLLMVLFIPIRYQVLGEKDENVLSADAKVAWFLRFIYVKIDVKNTDVCIRLRIAGIVIYDSLKPKKEKKKKEKTTKKKTKEKKNRTEKIEVKQESIETKKKIEEIEVKQGSIETKKKIEEIEVKQGSIETKKTIEEIEIKQESIDTEVNSTLIKTKQASIKSEEKLEITKIDEKQDVEDFLRVQDNHQDYDLEVKDSLRMDNQAEEEVEDNSQEDTPHVSKLGSFFGKIKSMVLKIKKILISIGSGFKSLKSKISSLVAIIRNINDKKKLVMSFLRDENNKIAIKKVFKSIWRICKHIAPKKIRGRIRFGTGDPCTTGQALGVAGALYGKYGDKITVEPDFEEEVFDGQLFIKGRIRLFTLLIISIKLIRDKQFKELIKNAKQLKEEL